jgi:hypothetical protein
MASPIVKTVATAHTMAGAGTGANIRTKGALAGPFGAQETPGFLRFFIEVGVGDGIG